MIHDGHGISHALGLGGPRDGQSSPHAADVVVNGLSMCTLIYLSPLLQDFPQPWVEQLLYPPYRGIRK